MNKNSFDISFSSPSYNRWLVPCILAAIGMGWFISISGMTVGSLLFMLPFISGWVVMVFLKPKVGLITFLFYCFILSWFSRHFPGLQFGLGMDAILVLTWAAIIFYRGNKYRWRHLNNDLVWFAVAWFAITALELANPERPSFQGWLQEMRGIAFYWILIMPLVFFVFNKKSDVNLFLNLIVLFSVLGALYGIKQLHIGIDDAEQGWLDAGAKRTHVLHGKLRVFSFFPDAAQFGASQAHLALVCLILALGPHTITKKILYAIAGTLIFYGMMISGTRGAIGGLIAGGFLYLVLSRQLRILLPGIVLGVAFIGILKYTGIGNSNDQVRRMRTSMDLKDPSFQVRLDNQQKLKEILKHKPLGTGVGTIGMWGVTYNKHIPSAVIPPDSLFVKVWVMYGIVGLIIWLGIMFYILGKSAAIIWKTRDPVLRNQLAALCAGSFGILVCSYGNEVMNQVPSSAIVYISWGLTWLSPRWDTPLQSSSYEKVAEK